MRAEREMFRIECRCTREHAVAVAHQLQRQAVARVTAQGDVGEHATFVGLGFIDQGQPLAWHSQVLQLA